MAEQKFLNINNLRVIWEKIAKLYARINNVENNYTTKDEFNDVKTQVITNKENITLFDPIKPHVENGKVLFFTGNDEDTIPELGKSLINTISNINITAKHIDAGFSDDSGMGTDYGLLTINESLESLYDLYNNIEFPVIIHHVTSNDIDWIFNSDSYIGHILCAKEDIMTQSYGDPVSEIWQSDYGDVIYTELGINNAAAATISPKVYSDKDLLNEIAGAFNLEEESGKKYIGSDEYNNYRKYFYNDTYKPVYNDLVLSKGVYIKTYDGIIPVKEYTVDSNGSVIPSLTIEGDDYINASISNNKINLSGTTKTKTAVTAIEEVGVADVDDKLHLIKSINGKTVATTIDETGIVVNNDIVIDAKDIKVVEEGDMYDNNAYETVQEALDGIYDLYNNIEIPSPPQTYFEVTSMEEIAGINNGCMIYIKNNIVTSTGVIKWESENDPGVYYYTSISDLKDNEECIMYIDEGLNEKHNGLFMYNEFENKISQIDPELGGIIDNLFYVEELIVIDKEKGIYIKTSDGLVKISE